MLSKAELPPQLHEFVVEQDYAQYTERDHAVWRFAVLHAHNRLLRTAHPAYASGFDAAGISVERIPRIEEMSAALSRIGWSAVCVDGFIPPRAFQAFQAHGVLPIAAEIRTSEHLVYTPAPDIIHEAAGHAPMLSDPTYARYLKRIGVVGGRAFASPKDHALYEAMYTLSVVKEDPQSTQEQLATVQQRFEALSQSMGEPSEAAKVARLYWWTVEYGLLGAQDRLRAYGAGLLSSISESLSTDDPRVIKLPLSAACIDVPYDITHEQPQLFVAESFEQLEPVLDQVTQGLSQALGGRSGLAIAESSGETATLTMDTGAQAVGVVKSMYGEGEQPALVELSGRCSLAHDHVVLDAFAAREGYLLPLGALADGTPLHLLDEERLRRLTQAGDRLALELAQGVEISGALTGVVKERGKLLVVILRDCQIAYQGRVLLRSNEPYPWALGTRVASVSRGSAEGHDAATNYSHKRVPKVRVYDAVEREIVQLHERMLATFRTLDGTALERACEQILTMLAANHPDEWLLRWNLLEGLIKAGERGALTLLLEEELAKMELRFERREPIATGLRTLRERP